ncbi:Ig-like domain-containing protein, partial [Psychrobacter sp. T6-6]
NGTVPQVSYTVTDPEGNTDSTTLDITVEPVNDAPVAVDDKKLDQTFGSDVTLDVLSNDTDPENDIDPATVIITQAPVGSIIATDGKSVVVANEGKWSVNETTGVITFEPEERFVGNPTPISYTVSDSTNLTSDPATVTIDYDQPTRTEVATPGRVSEEGLEGGNPDSDPNSTLDTTDSASDTVDNWIRVTDTDTDLADAVVGFTLPTTGNNIMSQGNPVIFRIDSATGNIIGEYEYIDSNNVTQIQNVLTISLNGNKEVITDGYQFGYDVTLAAPVDHTQGDDVEGILSINFGVEVFENASAIESLVQSDELLAIIEDDSPASQPVVWNIDVQQETITISGLQTGFTDSLFTEPTTSGYLIANNPSSANPGNTVSSRDYGGTVGELFAELDATYQAADGNTYVDTLDEAIYWGVPANQNGEETPPAGYTTREDLDYQGAGEEIKFETDLDLGDFSHINFGVFGNGGVLIETTLNIDFTMDVNGNSEPVNVDYLLKHNETINSFTTATFGLDTDTYSDVFVQSDFIVIPNASKIIDIAGQQYQLDITLANQDTDSSIDSDKNKDFLKIYQGYDGVDNDGDGRVDESIYSAVGNSIGGFIDQAANGTFYYDLNGNGILGDRGDAEYTRNTPDGYRYTILGNNDIAYIDADRDLVSDGIDFDGDNINDAVDINGDGRLDYIVYSTTGQRAEDTDGDGVIDRVDTNNDGIVDTDLVLDGSDYNPALDDAGTFVVNSEEGQENTYDVIGKLTPLNPLPKLSNNIVVEGKVAVGADTVNYLNSTGTGIVWSGVSTTDSDGTITTINTDSDATNYEFQTDYGVFIGYADGSYTFNAADNIADIVNPNADDIDVFSFEYQDSDGDTASSTVTLNYNEYAAPQSPDSINSIPSRTTADNDYLVGTNQAEVIEGGDGDDTLIGLSGIDSLFGGSGSDTVVFDRNDLVVDGGEGESSANIQDNDTLLINDLNVVAGNDMTQVVNFETIDMTNDTSQTLSLGLSDVVSITDNNNELFIKGDSTDTVNISGMTKSATSDQVGYDLYQDGANSAKLYVQTSIDDNVI